MAENKKDSFTFSDKIKNSKPAVNPFAKKGASKIGNNGKPKQTLFERSRRDAPFFVAAAAALLMLPFLYKYSGTVNDDVIVPPGSEDSVFDPERFGFSPSAEDPNNQIAQLAGRDPLSLIKGWGDPEEEQAEPVASYDRDGFDNENYTPARRVDTPNYRQTAPVATRAAFQRQATQVGKLGREGLNLRGGGGVGSRFGGAQLKAAARQSSASRPRPGAKPVSLTPLRAAGSPSRSYFGQGAAAQARASRDAMGKANAAEALRDAMFAPVDRGRTGGIGEGLFASGGGPGKFDHNMDFKGIEPWWWDMMKQQEMKKWEWEYFLWRKNLVEPLIQALAKVLATFGSNLACCIISGNSDCDADTVLGSNGSNSKESKCCGVNEKRFRAQFPEVSKAYPDDFKAACDAARKGDKGKQECPSGWQAGHSYSTKMNGFQTRWACLGGVVHGQGETDLRDRYNCEAINTTQNFELQATGKAAKWKNHYHVVVVDNYVPFPVGDDKSHYLCTSMEMPGVNPETRTGQQNVPGHSENHDVGRQTSSGQRYTYTDKDGNTVDAHTTDIVRDNINDGCVIYVAKGDNFRWTTFKSETIGLLNQMIPAEAGISGEEAFAQLRLRFIEGYAMKQTLARKWEKTKGKRVHSKSGGSHRSTVYKKVSDGMIDESILPVSYADFESFYVLHRSSADPSKSDKPYSDKDKRQFANTYEGVDSSTRTSLADDGKETAIRSQQCPFTSFRITAREIEYVENDSGNAQLSIASNLSFDPLRYPKREDLVVTLTIKGSDGTTIIDNHTITNEEKRTWIDGNSFIELKNVGPVQQYFQNIPEGGNKSITAYWTATDPKTKKESKDQASYSSDKPMIPITETPPCEENMTLYAGVDADGCPLVKKCVNNQWNTTAEKEDPNCPNGKTSKCREGEKRQIQDQNGCPFEMVCQDGEWGALKALDEECLSQHIPQRSKGQDQDNACTSDTMVKIGECDVIIPCVDGQLDTANYRLQDPNCSLATVYQTDIKLFSLAGAIDEIPRVLTNHSHSEDAGHTYTRAQGPMLYTTIKNADDGKAISGRSVDNRSSDAALDFVNMVIQRVNRENKWPGYALDSLKNGQPPTIPQFMDALYIAQNTLEIQSVPKAAVCTLARGVALASHDPRRRDMRNEFGTFAIYMGLSGAYYPRLTTKGLEGNDPRFATDPYFGNNYVGPTGIWNKAARHIQRAQISGRYPLASLVSGLPAIGTKVNPCGAKDQACKNNPINQVNREGLLNQYDRDYVPVLFADTGKCSLLTDNMPVQDALNYIQRVLELGLDYKPEAEPYKGTLDMPDTKGGMMTGD